MPGNFRARQTHLELNVSATRLRDIIFLFLLPYYRRHAPKKNRVSGESMVEFVSGS